MTKEKDKMDKNSIVGEQVKLKKGQIEVIENVLSYTVILDSFFKKLMQESRDANLKVYKLWDDLNVIAKKQYPEHDSKIHTLVYNWPTKSLTIATLEDKKRGLLE